MSGGRTKTSMPQYLKNFVEAKVIAECTMRRGFAANFVY
jgi:hypothetical protein